MYLVDKCLGVVGLQSHYNKVQVEQQQEVIY